MFDFSSRLAHVGGWIANNLKAIDFAGGTAVHINAGVAGLALAIILGKRHRLEAGPDAPAQPHPGHARRRPAVVRLVRLQRRLGRRRQQLPPPTVWVNTMVATGAACLAWLLTERIRDGHATSLGAASGVVAGLVAITPSCSSVSPIGAIIVGAVAGVVCALAIGLKYKLGYDDSLDVVGVHLVGGLWGTLAVGLPGHQGRSGAASTALLRRRFRPAVAPGRRCAGRAALQLHPHLRDRLHPAQDHRLPGQPRRRSSRASTASSTRRPDTTSARWVATVRGGTSLASGATRPHDGREQQP